MNPRHHLDEATLVSRAAGALSAEMSAVVDTHLDGCAHCQGLLVQAERVGGTLLMQQQPPDTQPDRVTQLRQQMLERLAVAPVARSQAPRVAPRASTDDLPRPLQRYFGPTWKALRWRWVAPGVHMIRARDTGDDNLILLKIAPGKSMPVHSHHGAELTQILKGAYDDELGHFGPGDVADLDDGVEHQPVTSPGVPCICVAALNGPLKFRGWFARKLQPMVGL